MTKVLILAYDFPPYVSVGALRPFSWYRYLKDYDVYPIIVTRQWANKYGNQLDYVAPGELPETLIEETEYGTLIKTPYHPNISNRLLLKFGDSRFKFLRKAITGFYEFFQFPFFIGPKTEIYNAANKFLSENKVDAIIATGDPFILFKYASQLSQNYDIPWYADYRDPWIQNKKSNGFNFFLMWQSYFEKKFLKNVETIFTVSSFVKAQIIQNQSGKEFEFITNGYDPQGIDEIRKIPQNKTILSIAFMGTVYKWHPIKQFLEVCNELIMSNFSLQLNFYGISNENEVLDPIKEDYFALKDKIRIYPKMSNKQLLNNLAANNILLLFNDYSILGTKIYDYLAIQRKIILCFIEDKETQVLKKKHYYIKEFEDQSQHLQQDLILETNSGIVVKDKGHLKQVLNDIYTEFTQNGFIACNSNGIEKYSRKIQAQKLAEILKAKQKQDLY
ncbi:MAG: hypothetical protein M0P66_12335 [Salinivirgaceae bacterium]|nr:hypothetical protein [Salinivirgaceae bacterium]